VADGIVNYGSKLEDLTLLAGALMKTINSVPRLRYFVGIGSRITSNWPYSLTRSDP
jgi:hypothetical protein